MIFRDLYERVTQLAHPPVGFDFLRKVIGAYHQEIGRVDVWAVNNPIPTRQAHFRLGFDRSSPYEEEFTVAQIIYCEELDKDERERRFALTKELMHVFDGPEARTDSREKFEQLLREIQNKPLPGDASQMLKTELDTRWMAAIILCPKKFRDEMLADYRAKKLEDFDVAERFDVPEWVVSFVMDDYYDKALARLLGT